MILSHLLTISILLLSSIHALQYRSYNRQKRATCPDPGNISYPIIIIIPFSFLSFQRRDVPIYYL